MNVIMDVVEMTNQLSEIHPQVKTYGSLSPKLIETFNKYLYQNV